MKTRLLSMILAAISLQTFAEDGYLKLKANVENVEITVGSQRQTIGTEWSFITLSPGSYRVRASKQDYQTQSVEVSIRGGRVETRTFEFKKASGFKVKKPKSVAVIKGYGDLTIITDIPGATVKLNGQSVSGEMTPITVEELAEGTWAVEVTLQGKHLSQSVQIKPNELETVRFFFDRNNKYAYEQTEQRRIREASEKEHAKKRAAIRGNIIKSSSRAFQLTGGKKTELYNNFKCSSKKWLSTKGGWRFDDYGDSTIWTYKSELVDLKIERKHTYKGKQIVVQTLRKIPFRPVKSTYEGVYSSEEWYINGRRVETKTSTTGHAHADKIENDDVLIERDRNSYNVTIKNYDYLLNALIDRRMRN